MLPPLLLLLLLLCCSNYSLIILPGVNIHVLHVKTFTQLSDDDDDDDVQ